jgi:hypothetical protein
MPQDTFVPRTCSVALKDRLYVLKSEYPEHRNIYWTTLNVATGQPDIPWSVIVTDPHYVLDMSAIAVSAQIFLFVLWIDAGNRAVIAWNQFDGANWSAWRALDPQPTDLLDRAVEGDSNAGVYPPGLRCAVVSADIILFWNIFASNDAYFSVFNTVERKLVAWNKVITGKND